MRTLHFFILNSNKVYYPNFKYLENMSCSETSFIFILIVLSLFIFLVVTSLNGEDENFNKRWPTSYYEQGDWAKNKRRKGEKYKRYNSAMWYL